MTNLSEYYCRKIITNTNLFYLKNEFNYNCKDYLLSALLTELISINIISNEIEVIKCSKGVLQERINCSENDLYINLNKLTEMDLIKFEETGIEFPKIKYTLSFKKIFDLYIPSFFNK